MADKLIELAERCEAAEGADRELDAEIGAAVHMKMLTHQPSKGRKGDMRMEPDIVSTSELLELVDKVRCCSDFDEDCNDVPDKVHCYLYDPVRGYCPYLRATQQET